MDSLGLADGVMVTTPGDPTSSSTRSSLTMLWNRLRSRWKLIDHYGDSRRGEHAFWVGGCGAVEG